MVKYKNMKIAIILTVFNRKKETINCLNRLYKTVVPEGMEFVTYLTDDGSSDGTSDEVKQLFPQVIITKGNGHLFWAGGMNASWNRAIGDGGFDGYIWLNNDTFIEENIFSMFLEADKYAKNKYYTGGIYIGATLSLDRTRYTYGGSIYKSKMFNKLKFIVPNGDYQECEIGCGNITYVDKSVVDKLGCFYPGYVHGADYDYTYWAHSCGFPVLVMPTFMGYCDDDHKSHREQLLKRTFRQRIEYLYSPIGLQFKTALLFQKRFFPYRLPYVFISYWIKTIFPFLIKKR